MQATGADGRSLQLALADRSARAMP
jgi:hypothetical protein